MLDVHEADELFNLDITRKKISGKVQSLYDHPIKIGQDLENMKRAHAFFKELNVLLMAEANAVGNMERFLEKVIEKYS